MNKEQLQELSDDQLDEITGGGFLDWLTGGVSGTTTERNGATLYTVGRGDSLKAIAKHFNTTEAAILALNSRSDPKYGNHILHSGDKLQPTWILRVK